jgi:hypothetical protein
MDRITTDNDTTKSIKGDRQPGESMHFSKYLFLYAFILLIHVQMLFPGFSENDFECNPEYPVHQC